MDRPQSRSSRPVSRATVKSAGTASTMTAPCGTGDDSKNLGVARKQKKNEYPSEQALQRYRRRIRVELVRDVKDKYGYSGITGLVILCKKSSYIDTFLLSCRIIGRKIEYALMDSVVQIAVDNGIEGLSAEFIRTIKNNQVEHFYKSCGFDVISESQDINKYFIYNASYVNSAITYKKE